MAQAAVRLPIRRTELIIGPTRHDGGHVVKDPSNGFYFELGGQEAFLLERLDGSKSSDEICEEFDRFFDEPLTIEELAEFIGLARSRGFLQPGSSPEGRAPIEQNVDDTNADLLGSALESSLAADDPVVLKHQQHILFWRKSLFDPDRLFGWLEPQIRFIWTRAFLYSSMTVIGLAMFVAWSNGAQLVTHFSQAFRIETLLLAWLALGIVTTFHEFAHGLTCKRYGGEVHEIGFLLMFFMPCFYCNVSDAWLIPEKSKRLWVTFAGGYCDLCVWALAILVWRISFQDSLLNYLAWVVLAIAGGRVFFNFNPLIKLDGYYLLSDLLEIPNLRQRSIDYAMGWLRRILWGADRPERELRGKFLALFGIGCWSFSMFFICLMLWFLGLRLRPYLGLAGFAFALFLGFKVIPNLLNPLFAGEVKKMIWKRHKRTAIWVMVATGLIAALVFVPWHDRASGTFEVRPVVHAEIRAPEAGFLTVISCDEGEHVTKGMMIARLSLPDLASRVSQKQAEVSEAQAKLKLLRAGSRDVELDQQRRRVAAAKTWRDIAKKNLAQQSLALVKELEAMDQLLEQHQAEHSLSLQMIVKDEELVRKGAVSTDVLLKDRKEALVFAAHLQKTRAEKSARELLGTLGAESDLAERESALVAEEAELALLESGTRPEEIEASEASLARLVEELQSLLELEKRLSVTSPVDGAVTTPRLKEKIGDYFEEGKLICEIEDPENLEVVITLDEEQAARLEVGQEVRLKARALPFDVFKVRIERIAPKAVEGDLQSQVTLYCNMEDTVNLRSGMTGHARINCGSGSLGEILTKRFLRFLRTEFWW
jgi:multidrug efflux pump subunit AcrA (membrane-fusion protein)